jgi:membrane protein DedA with SNARE-associated domain
VLSHLVATYGYWAVLIGTFFEGETVLVMAGFAARAGYLSLPWVVVTAFVGSLCGDQLWFLVGRRWGPELMARRPTWQRRMKRVRHMLERHKRLVMVGFRFLYGVRSVTPFTIGMSGVAVETFAPLNAIGAILWAAVLGPLGYAFGEAMHRALERANRFEMCALSLIFGLGMLLWVWSYVRDRKRRRDSALPGADAKADDGPIEPTH